MDRFEFEYLKSMILKRSDVSYEDVSLLFELLQSKFGFGDFDIFEIFHKCPQLLNIPVMAVEKNIKEFEKKFRLSSTHMRYFFLKFPFMILVNHKLLEFKIDLLSTVFACSKNEVINKFIICPDLLFISKIEIKNQIAFLSENLDEFGEGIRRILRDYPETLFLKKENLKEIEKIMLHDFTFSKDQVNTIFKICPEIMFFTSEKLKEVYDFYYPKYFVKRDIKELFSSCPQLFLLSKEEFEGKIETIKSVLNANEKETLNFVRCCPDSLLFENPKTKFDWFRRFNINLEFLKHHPKIFMAQEFSIPLKFIFARILGLESEFEKICEIDTKTFISRFLFMQSKKLYSHEDLILSEQEFFEKYKVSSEVLKICYIVSDENLNQICAYYVNLKGQLPNWTDIVFPNTKDVVRFVKEKVRINHQVLPYEILKEKYNFTKKQYKLLSVLHSLYLDNDECMFLIKKCKSLASSSQGNIIGTFHFLRKQGFSFEDVVRLLFEKPTIFTHFIGDFENIFNQTMKFYHCQPKEAIKHIC